eukprot:CAMPEP_0172733484 /NCGR_PEP_ID=MMETSP1074-20121228/107305_1 /TAXON_ID=2916 /ORGANISM="Ceratium fusus, Strain PA161109" /LENGTH=81 /DNA_ID=CAMNT_0013562053 /DNA_START=751 /DNA_END=997 /DNA_ORIENTATION=-
MEHVSNVPAIVAPAELLTRKVQAPMTSSSGQGLTDDPFATAVLHISTQRLKFSDRSSKAKCMQATNTEMPQDLALHFGIGA